jgi:hypothetical protein
MGVFLTEAEAVEMMLNAGVKPLTSYPGTKVGWKSVCLTCQNIVSPRLGNIRSGQNACGYCSGVRVNVSDAIKLFESINLKPIADYPGAQKPWLSKCLTCGSEVTPSYTSVQQGRGGCVFCAGNRITIDQVLNAMKDAGYEPLEAYVSSARRWKCKCLNCGKISTPRYNDVQQGNRCGYCSKVKIDEEDAVRIMLDAKLEPLEPFKTANTKWKCRCLVCGNIVFPRYGTIQAGHGGCGFCATYGFNLEQPAIMYLITNNELSAHKIGITNLYESKENSRMMKHRQNGWSTFKTKEFRTGQAAVQVENQLIDWLRNEKGLMHFLTAEQMPQGGWTETVDASEIDLSSIWAKVEELSKVEM